MLMKELSKYFRRGSPIERLSRLSVHRLLDPRNPLLDHLRKVGLLWEKLTDQTVRVFVCATLPRAMRASKVDLDFRLLGKQPVLSHFLSVVIRQRLTQVLCQVTHDLGKRFLTYVTKAAFVPAGCPF
jgi:hypothetical protein